MADNCSQDNNCSQDTFVKEDIFKKLKIGQKATSISIKTLNVENTFHLLAVDGLQVCNFNTKSKKIWWINQLERRFR